MNRLALSAAALMAAASFASAIGTSWTYQGTLLDSGAPANGVYDVQVQLYDAPAGGTLLGTIGFNNANIVKGTFTAELDFGSAFNDGQDRWLAIGIRPGPSGGAYTVLTPRQQVLPTPHAIRSQSTQTLYQFGDAPNEGQVVARTYNHSGEGGAVSFYEEDGVRHSFIEPDIDGEGGFFTVYGPAGSIIVNGSSGTGTGPTLFGTGPSSAFTFDTNTTGDNSVMLPSSSVSAAEMFNEPGVASDVVESPVAIGTTDTVIAARTITVPGPGYVLAIGTSDMEMTYNGSTLNLLMGVTPSASIGFGGALDQQWYLPSGLPVGSYVNSMTAHALFPVSSAGSHTFYLMGTRIIGASTVNAYDNQLTLVYLPTAYGTVDTNGVSSLIANDPQTNLSTKGLPGLTDGELVQEQITSTEDNFARVDAELKAVREEMKRMRQQMGNGEDAQIHAE